MRGTAQLLVALVASLALFAIAAGVAAAAPNTAYVVNSGSNSLTPIETATNKPGAEIKVGNHPEAIAITPNGLTAYVTSFNTSSVIPVELATGKLGAEIKTGGAAGAPMAIAISQGGPTGKTAYVVNSVPGAKKVGSVTPIELATNTAGPEILVGEEPEAIAITPNGQTAYVVNAASASVTPIELATNKPGPEIKVGNNPKGIAIAPNGQTAYVTNAGSNSVTPIELAANKPGTEIKLGGPPRAIAITPNGQTAYVGLLSKSVTPIELATNKAGTEIPLTREPRQIAITPNGQTAYVSTFGDSSVTPIEVATNKAGAEIKVGVLPVGIAITGPAPHWTSGGSAIANAVKTPVVLFGGATNLAQQTIGEINCKTVGGGFVENVEGQGRGKVQALARWECKAPACEAEVKEKFGVAGRAEVTTENLPEPTVAGKPGSEGWETELFEGKSAAGGENSPREKIGETWTKFPEGGQEGHESPPGMMRFSIRCEIPSTKTPLVEAFYEGAVEPEIGEAFNGSFNGISALHPSELGFFGETSGRLNSEKAGGEGQGYFTGSLKYLGYTNQSVIGVGG
jgi:YVTN family beta-propeller protein